MWAGENVPWVEIWAEEGDGAEEIIWTKDKLRP
jgi:hypothetical protein